MNPIYMNVFLKTLIIAVFLSNCPLTSMCQALTESPVEYVSCNFENASPLFWENGPDGSAIVHILYDHERSTPNRASNHVLFQVQAKKGSDVVLKVQFFDEIWNGNRVASQALVKNYFISNDGKNWTVIPAESFENGHKLKIHMDTENIYVTQMEPYRISDLEGLIGEIQGNPRVNIIPIGKTVEGRQLEILRVGSEDAPYRVFIRARAHPWEAGGNWVVQGLIRNLLDANGSKYLDRYCVYILPMENKDGVAHGYTRFNCMGIDLNRGMNRPADPLLSPENAALESWMKMMIKKGLKPDLTMDLHNDRNGKLDFGDPSRIDNENYQKGSASLQDSYTVLTNGVDMEKYRSNTRRFEALMYRHTWYTWTDDNIRKDASNSGKFDIPRYDIDLSCILELNQVWIEGLKKVPFGKDWEMMGKELCDVFYYYFE